MQSIGRHPNPPIRAPNGTPVHFKRHRPEQTTLYRLVQKHAATLFEQAESASGAGMPQFVKDKFDALLKCGILARGFLRRRCGDCGHAKLIAYICKRRRFCLSCGARRMAQAAAHLVDHLTAHVRLRQWILLLRSASAQLQGVSAQVLQGEKAVLRRRQRGPEQQGQSHTEKGIRLPDVPDR